jgi:uncharacterized protein YpmB
MKSVLIIVGVIIAIIIVFSIAMFVIYKKCKKPSEE